MEWSDRQAENWSIIEPRWLKERRERKRRRPIAAKRGGDKKKGKASATQCSSTRGSGRRLDRVAALKGQESQTKARGGRAGDGGMKRE